MIINCILKKPVYTDYVLDAVSLQKKPTISASSEW